jgi:hypothetical protein
LGEIGPAPGPKCAIFKCHEPADDAVGDSCRKLFQAFAPIELQYLVLAMAGPPQPGPNWTAFPMPPCKKNAAAVRAELAGTDNDAPSPGFTSSTAPESRRAAKGTILALFGYLTMTTVVMWPALTNMSTTVMGNIQPNDGTAGAVWLGWQMNLLAPFANHTPMLNAPIGKALWQGADVTALAWIVPLWVFAHLFGNVGGWNLDLALGFVLDGLAMFGLVRWLVGHDWIGFVAGLLYAFSAFHLEESYAHIGYVDSWVFPLILWAGLALLRQPTSRQGLSFGVIVGAAAYVDGYYILFAPLLAVIIAAGGFVWSRSLRVARRKLMAPMLSAIAAYTIIVIPIAAVYLVRSGHVRESFNRPIVSVEAYSARLWEYVVPWAESPTFGPLYGLFPPWRVASKGVTVTLPFGLHWGQGLTEGSLYLGISVVLLALGLGFGLVGGSGLSQWTGPRLPVRFLAWTLPAGACLVALCSLASIGPVAGFPVLVWDVFPHVRVYSRMFVVVDCLTIVAASVTLAYFARCRRRWLAPLLSLIAIVDACAVLPWSSWSYATASPAPYRWLEHHQNGGIVAEYPMIDNNAAWTEYLTFQSVHLHPLFNGAPVGSSRAEVQHGLADLSDDQTVPGLRHFGVKYVVVHRPLYHVRRNKHFYLHGLRPIISGQGVTLYRFAHARR